MIKRLLWSTVKYCRRPWAKPMPGVLRRVDGTLQRALPVDISVTCFDLGPEDNEILIGGEEGELHVVDKVLGRLRYRLSTNESSRGHSKRIIGVHLCKERKKLLSSSWDGSIRVWHKKGEIRQFRPFHDFRRGDVSCMSVIPQRNMIACGGEAGIVRLIEFETGIRVREFAELDGNMTAIAVSPNGEELLCGSINGELYLWNLMNGSLLAKKTTGLICVQSPRFCENVPVVVNSGTETHCFKINSNSLVPFYVTRPRCSRVDAATFANNGKTLWVGLSDGRIVMSATNGV